MNLEILDEEKISHFLERTNLIAYSDSFARFAESVYSSRRFFVGAKEEYHLKAFFSVFESVKNNQKIEEVPLFIYTEIFFIDSEYILDANLLGRQLAQFLKSDVLRFNLYNFSGLGNLKTESFKQIFVAMVATLKGRKDYEDYLKNSLSKNARSKIYKAYSVGLELVNLSENDLAEFYTLYSEHVKLLGSKPHSIEYFQNMIRAYNFGNDLFMLGARYRGKLITANLFITNKDYMEVRFLADDINFRHLYPNNFLYAELVRWAFDNNINFIDFGGIPKSMQTNIEFKASFGAKEYPIYTKYFFRNPWQKFKFKFYRKLLYWRKYRNRFLKTFFLN